jgi:hypothetical protein
VGAQQTWKLALQSSCVWVKKNMDKITENELKFGEDAQHIHVALNILVMNLFDKIQQVLQAC